MLKRLFLITLLTAWTPQVHSSLKLSNPLLKVADQAGLFNRAIFDILKVRQKVKDFVAGKLHWKGADCNLTIVDANNNPLSQKLRVIIKRPEALYGATFVAINTNHPLITILSTPETQPYITDIVAHTHKKSSLTRYENPSFEAAPTNFFVINPFSQEKMPIFITDYSIEDYDTRTTHAHIAIPGHDHKDFVFAQMHKLPIKQVITSPELDRPSSPQINKTTKQLTSAYLGEYNDCLIINSDDLNGAIQLAHEAALQKLQDTIQATVYSKPMVYHLGSKQYSLHELQLIEMTLAKENKSLSPAQKDALTILMIQAQADFLTIVEQFLINAKEAKELMVELIDESCKLRDNNQAYLLKWAHLNTNEPEKTVFKRDISSFTNLCKFCSELIDFLGDFASSCTNALDTIKHIKHS